MQTAGVQATSLSPQQERLWRWQPSQQGGSIQAMIKLEGPLHVTPFEQALQHTVEQHELLRSTFATLVGMDLPVQVVQEQVEVPCPLQSLEGIELARQQELLEQQWQQWGAEAGDLTSGRVLQAW